MYKCRFHKRYKAKLKPRCDCVECWRMFLEKTDNYQIICQEIEYREINGRTIVQETCTDKILIQQMLMDKKREIENNF